MLPSSISVLSLWVETTPLLSMRTSQGHPVLLFFLGGPHWEDSVFPGAVVPVLALKYFWGTGTHQSHTTKLTPVLTANVSFAHWAAQVEEFRIWKGWKSLSLGCSALEASQLMALREMFCLKVSGRTGQHRDQLGSRGQDMARKLHTRTEAL